MAVNTMHSLSVDMEWHSPLAKWCPLESRAEVGTAQFLSQMRCIGSIANIDSYWGFDCIAGWRRRKGENSPFGGIVENTLD